MDRIAKKNKVKNKVFVYVEGGVVHVIKAHQPVDVVVVDADNLVADGQFDEQITKDWDKLTKGAVVVY
jgi:methylthioribose-1-phosphate isomerase